MLWEYSIRLSYNFEFKFYVPNISTFGLKFSWSENPWYFYGRSNEITP